MKPATIVIKKYPNRRLYDTTGSRYVNLDEIAALVQQGKDLQVIDAQTGQDLTRVTLTQIITEHAKERPGGLPLELLRQLIVATDQVGQEFLAWYLKSAFDTYQKVQGAVHNRLNEVQSAIFSPVDAMKRFLEPSGTAVSATPAEDDEVAALRRRVAQLEARVNGNTEPKPARGPAGQRTKAKKNISRRAVTRAADGKPQR
jgi:polyhydroxyalkanoate synthesis repressor PhaR